MRHILIKETDRIPGKVVLRNRDGDTFSYNPTKYEEFDDFLHNRMPIDEVYLNLKVEDVKYIIDMLKLRREETMSVRLENYLENLIGDFKNVLM